MVAEKKLKEEGKNTNKEKRGHKSNTVLRSNNKQICGITGLLQFLLFNNQIWSLGEKNVFAIFLPSFQLYLFF